MFDHFHHGHAHALQQKLPGERRPVELPAVDGIGTHGRRPVQSGSLADFEGSGQLCCFGGAADVHGDGAPGRDRAVGGFVPVGQSLRGQRDSYVPVLLSGLQAHLGEPGKRPHRCVDLGG